MGVFASFEFNPQSNPQHAVSCAILNDLRGVWQSPQSCKSLKNLTAPRCHGRGREFESRRPRHSFL
jgi:hypothetical protein